MKKTEFYAEKDHFGFWLTFPNGVVLSTIWGPATYSDNHDNTDFSVKGSGSTTVEVAIWYEGHYSNWITKKMIKDLFPNETFDNVMGYVDFDNWLRIVKWCREQKEG